MGIYVESEEELENEIVIKNKLKEKQEKLKTTKKKKDFILAIIFKKKVNLECLNQHQ